MASVSPEELYPHVQRLNDRWTTIIEKAESMLPGLTEAQWNWSPNSQIWSVALVCDHLNRNSELMIPDLEDAILTIRAANAPSEAPWNYNRIERNFIRFSSPNPPFKVPVPSIYKPVLMRSPAEAGVRFLDFALRFRSVLLNSNGLNMEPVAIPLPANKLIKLSAAAWLEATVGHTEYHWLQVEALKSDTRFPNV